MKKNDKYTKRHIMDKVQKSDSSLEIKNMAEKTQNIPFHLVGFESNGYKIVSIIPSAIDESLFVTFECTKCGRKIPMQIKKYSIRNLECKDCGHLVKVVSILDKDDNGDFESFHIIGNYVYRHLSKRCTNEDTRVRDIATLFKRIERIKK